MQCLMSLYLASLLLEESLPDEYFFLQIHFDGSLCLGNLWLELWETAKPVPAVRQAPLFDEDLAV